MDIRKFQQYENEGNVRSYPESVKELVQQIENNITSPIELEPIQQLVELCYKIGFRDGYRFADWLHEKTQ